MTYQKDIIDIGDRASQLAYRINCESYENSPAVTIVRTSGNFRGPVGWVWKKHILKMMQKGKMMETMENDGAGGKPQFFAVLSSKPYDGAKQAFEWLGWEIVAMCADDFARSGRFPVIIANEMNVKRLTERNFHLFESIMMGYDYILHAAGLVSITGETAIMPNSITAFYDADNESQLVLNWGAACVGLCHTEKLIDGSKIKADMPVVGFAENGYRCNGGTFFARLLARRFDPMRWRGMYQLNPVLDDIDFMSFIKRLCTPSISYSKLISCAHGWEIDGRIGKPIVSMAGIAHITGGGVWKKFGDILPRGIGAYLNDIPRNALLWDAQMMAEKFPDLRISDWDMYGTFHGGCGMLVVCETNVDAETLIELAKKFGVRASVVGKTGKFADSEIIIESKYKEKRRLLSSLERK